MLKFVSRKGQKSKGKEDKYSKTGGSIVSEKIKTISKRLICPGCGGFVSACIKNGEMMECEGCKDRTEANDGICIPNDGKYPVGYLNCQACSSAKGRPILVSNLASQQRIA